MEELLSIAILIALVYWGYRLAEKQGRNIGWAIVLTICFGIFAIIGYYIAGPKEKEPDKTIKE